MTLVILCFERRYSKQNTVASLKSKFWPANFELVTPLIVSTLVLRLKAAESFLVTSHCTYQYNSVEVQKNPD